MRRAAGCLVAISVCLPAYAAGPVNEAYVRSLAAPGKTVLIMEYYDGQGNVPERKGYASASGFKAITATDFQVDANLTVRLFGIEPCQGDMVNRKEDFAGSCDAYARQGLATLLQSPRVIYCRTFVSETGAQVQDATCYGYYNYPGSLDTVDMFEEQLVSVGSHRIAKRPDGTPARADLKEAEDIGRRGYGMWADPRIAGQ
ncbi:hypothetical protein [Mesorhizobium sp. GR13]|uniref:hypothetical protein n=1 Tax=Mesorhizobium sp. GR13 TaxID=2562308 RepID=UPI001484E3A6|nr:hypothetical protein [Mesorhizobium sp. GR13]